ncbi:CPCC family cysteine-rich protein [Streptomyces cyaneofuscatus]|uniref:CPCC family cysteine-rich protein n=1 Tax=Streptomyces cyaneofuscatus TaxID=66883 RepID=UPI00381D3C62
MPGSYEICPVCFWEDDGVQSRWPTVGGGTSAFQPRTSSSTLCLAPHRSHTRLLRGLARRGPPPLGPTTARYSAGGSPLSGAGTTHIERLIQQLDDSTGPGRRATFLERIGDAAPVQ